MYRVYCDGVQIYNSKLETYQIFSPSLELELNKTGSFLFTIYQDHPYYGLIKKLKSIITVWQDDYLLFRGRVLDDEMGWHNERKITCEGELAFLIDSIQRPYDYTGTVAGYLNLLVSRHNEQVDESKWFTVGNVTVTDNNDYIVRANSEYTDTWKEMQDKLLGLMGGYLVVRHDGYINYLDYLEDINLLSPQKIEFGKNLLDLKRIRKGGDIMTAVIPLGAKLRDAEDKETDERLTIADLNGGLDYIADEEAVAQYGFIVKTVIFDDVTEAANLLTKGQAYLAQNVNLPDTVELTAADLATVDKDILSFHLGTKVQVVSKPHGVDQLFTVNKLKIELMNPAANKLTLGGVVESFSGAFNGLVNGQGVLLQVVEQTAKNASEAVYNVEQNLQAAISQTAENITARVAEEYTLKEDAEALVSSVSTELSLTKSGLDIQFTKFEADIQSIVTNNDAEFEEIRKYIRFIDGKILLGEVGNELELEIANDRISFLQDGAEVAYFSNRKLYVTDTQILHSLQLGNFAFMPRENGNLSFKKI